jgi:hypothetical protein
MPRRFSSMAVSTSLLGLLSFANSAYAGAAQTLASVRAKRGVAALKFTFRNGRTRWIALVHAGESNERALLTRDLRLPLAIGSMTTLKIGGIQVGVWVLDREMAQLSIGKWHFQLHGNHARSATATVHQWVTFRGAKAGKFERQLESIQFLEPAQRQQLLAGISNPDLEVVPTLGASLHFHDATRSHGAVIRDIDRWAPTAVKQLVLTISDKPLRLLEVSFHVATGGGQ